MTTTRIVFADKLAIGDTVTDPCRGDDADCLIDATRHGPGHTHERTIIDRRAPGHILAIAVDEDGEQQLLDYDPNTTVRILVRDTFPADKPAEETQR